MSRIQAMIDDLEQGHDLTRQQLRNVLRLQALDLVREGELFVDQVIEQERLADVQF